MGRKVEIMDKQGNKDIEEAMGWVITAFTFGFFFFSLTHVD